MLIDGRAIANKIYDSVTARVARLPFQPVFCDVLVGHDPASVQYVNLKARVAERVGMRFLRAEFSATISQDELVANIVRLGDTPNLSGLIVQLPLPDNFLAKAVLDAIRPEVDVDCLHPKNIDLFYSGAVKLIPPTPAAVLAVLDSVLALHYTSSFAESARYAVLGQGALVGHPVAYLLKQRGLNVVPVDIATACPEQLVKEADVVITGIGKPGLVTAGWIKPGAIVVDAGTAEDGGAIVGDVDIDSVEPVAGWVSPTPGGVGPVTVAKLLENVVTVAEKQVVSSE